jgi:hypothetical protein
MSKNAITVLIYHHQKPKYYQCALFLLHFLSQLANY